MTEGKDNTIVPTKADSERVDGAVPTWEEVRAEIVQIEKDLSTQVIGGQEHNFRRLKQSLRHSQGNFALFFVGYDGVPQRKLLVQRLRAELPDQNPVELQLNESDESLLDKLLAAPGTPEPLFVYGIEKLLPTGDALDRKLRREKTLHELQLQRERFRQLGRPLLLWMPEYAYAMIGQQAVDFWSWQRGAFFFTEIQARRVGASDDAPVDKQEFEMELSWRRHLDSPERRRFFIWGSVLTWLVLILFSAQVAIFASRLLHLGSSLVTLFVFFGTLLLIPTSIYLGLGHSRVVRGLARAFEFYFWMSLPGALYERIGKQRKALKYYERAVRVARRASDKLEELYHLNKLGDVYKKLGETHEAINNYEHALAVAREGGIKTWENIELWKLGEVYRDSGNVREAIVHYESALAIAREIGERKPERFHLLRLGDLYKSLGEPREAIKHYELVLVIDHEVEEKSMQGLALMGLGDAYWDLGEAQEAIKRYEQALAIASEIGQRAGEGALLRRLGGLYRSLGEVREAIKFYERSLPIDREIGNMRWESIELWNLGEAYRDLGEVREAIRYYEQALAIDLEIGERKRECIDLKCLGISYAGIGREQEAKSYVDRAVEIARELGDKDLEGEMLTELGDEYAKQSRKEAAIKYLEAGLKLFEKTESENIEFVRRRLAEVRGEPVTIY